MAERLSHSACRVSMVSQDDGIVKLEATRAGGWGEGGDVLTLVLRPTNTTKILRPCYLQEGEKRKGWKVEPLNTCIHNSVSFTTKVRTGPVDHLHMQGH